MLRANNRKSSTKRVRVASPTRTSSASSSRGHQSSSLSSIRNLSTSPRGRSIAHNEFSRRVEGSQTKRTSASSSAMATRKSFRNFSAGNDQHSTLGFTYPVSRKLEGVVNMELFATQAPETITAVWQDYHAGTATAVAAVIPTESFQKLQQRGPNTRFFTVPIKRETGYFVMLSQFQDKSFLLTYLEDFKKDPATAQPYLTITLYDELVHSKGIALARADICALATLTKQDADVLLNRVLEAYSDDGMFQYVFDFNNNPQSFNFDEYLKICDI